MGLLQSLILAKYLERNAGLLGLAHSRVIELGAGRGLAGMAAAALGARVTLTDAPSAVDALRRVVEVVNEFRVGEAGAEGGAIEAVAPLDWTDREKSLPSFLSEPHGFDFIIGADIVWVDWLVKPLVATINAILSKKHSAACLLAHQSRSERTDEKLWAELTAKNILRQTVKESMDPRWWKERVVIWELRKMGRQSEPS